MTEADEIWTGGSCDLTWEDLLSPAGTILAEEDNNNSKELGHMMA